MSCQKPCGQHEQHAALQQDAVCSARARQFACCLSACSSGQQPSRHKRCPAWSYPTTSRSYLTTSTGCVADADIKPADPQNGSSHVMLEWQNWTKRKKNLRVFGLFSPDHFYRESGRCRNQASKGTIQRCWNWRNLLLLGHLPVTPLQAVIHSQPYGSVWQNPYQAGLNSLCGSQHSEP